MKFKHYSYLLVFTLLFVLFSCAEREEEEMDIAQVRAAIEETNFKFCEAFRQGDAAAVASFYTEDATLLPPNSEMIRGRQEIEKLANTMMQMGVWDYILTIVDVFGSDDLAYEIGKYTVTIQPEGQEEPIEDMGKYVVVWKLQEDGSWKLHVDIWNTSMPLPQP